MNIFEMLDRESKQRGLPFLIIGGYAVNAYGHSRFTKDLDILVKREQREAWHAALEQNGFAFLHDGGSFLRFKAPAGDTWPLDLMLVNASTFAKLRMNACEYPIGPHVFLIPSLDGLFALKFHVLKQEIPERGFKDLLDVLELARCNGIDLRSDRVKSLCEKFGNPKVYERVIAFNT